MGRKTVILWFFTGCFLCQLGCGKDADKKMDGAENRKSRQQNKEGSIMALPEPKKEGEMSVAEAIDNRRSVRRFSEKELTSEEVGQLLWAAQGITDKKQNFRAAPSAGATYPLEAYAVTAEGVYHYIPEKHALEKHVDEDLRAKLSTAALNQRWVKEAPLVIVLTAIPERTTGNYGERGIRYVHMEAGHVAENIHLQAVSLGLGSVPTGAFKDSAVETVLEVPEKQQALYLIPVGHPE